jgi:hexulose-6-phosphate isomerase
MEQAKAAGFGAVELCVGETGELSLGTSKKRCSQILADAKDVGIEVSGLATGIFWGYSFGASSDKIRGKASKAARECLRLGHWLEVDALLTIPASVDVFFNPAAEVVPYDVALKRAKEGIERCLPTAEKCGVVMAVENVWNKLFLSPVEMADFIDSFKSKYVGAYFDVGNCVAMGYPEQWIRILGKRIKRVHFKDFRRAAADVNGFVDLLEGDVNWPEVMKALREVGYDGPVTAEMIPLYAFCPEVRIKNTSTAMDAILAL